MPCDVADQALRTKAACDALRQQLAAAKVLFNDPSTPSKGKPPAKIVVGKPFQEKIIVTLPSGEGGAAETFANLPKNFAPGKLVEAQVQGGAKEKVDILPTGDFDIDPKTTPEPKALAPNLPPPEWDFTMTAKHTGPSSFTVRVTPLIYEDGKLVAMHALDYTHNVVVRAVASDWLTDFFKRWTGVLTALGALLVAIVAVLTKAWRALGPIWRLFFKPKGPS